MKICVVVPSYYPAFVYGGPIISVHQTSRELARQGIEVTVSTTNANGRGRLDVPTQEYVELEERYKVRYYDETIVGRLSCRMIMSMWREILASDVLRIEDVFSVAVPVAVFYGRVFGKPMLISPRGSLSAWALGSKRALVKRVWLQCFIRPLAGRAWWHATSIQEAADIRRQFPEALIVTIPNGIDTQAFRLTRMLSRVEYSERFVSGITPPKWTIVSMGRLHKKKGFDILVEAFARMPDSLRDSHLLIAGADDGERGPLLEKVARLGLEDRVRLVGELGGEAKVQFLAGADLFVLPSHDENFGNVYLEALAAGVPIIASTGTPWSEVEREGCGRWIPNTVESVAAAMEEMLSTDLSAMREKARRFAARYDWSHVAAAFRAAFSEMLAASAERQ